MSKKKEKPGATIFFDRALSNEELTDRIVALEEILLELEQKLLPFGDRFVETRLLGFGLKRLGLRRLRST